MSVVIRIGEGRSKSGKIIDRNAKWFNIKNAKNVADAMAEHVKTKKPIYVSYNGRRYRQIDVTKLAEIGAKL